VAAVLVQPAGELGVAGPQHEEIVSIAAGRHPQQPLHQLEMAGHGRELKLGTEQPVCPVELAEDPAQVADSGFYL
jgi:hypothetical protein